MTEEQAVDATAVEEEIEDYKPSGGELVVPDAAHPEADVFRVLDRHDEKQILEEMQSRLLDATLYDFEQGGTKLVDLSYGGVREVIHLMTRTGKVRIRVIPGSLEVNEVVEDGEPYYVVDVWAEDQVTGEAYVGSSQQPKRMRLKASTAKRWRDRGRTVPEDNTVWDEFARTKAIAKASRNALKQFIPEEIRQTLIAQYLGDDKRITRIEAGAGAEKLAELPPPLTDERAMEQKAKARELYDEIRKHSPGGVSVGLVPGAFNQYLTRAEHDHDRLDDFLKFLDDKLVQARELKERTTA